jgi:hypothetical protein
LGVSEHRFYEDDLPSHLHDTEAVRWFLENGLEEKLLNNPAITAAWHDVAAWYHRYGTAPDRTYLRSEYPGLEVGEPTDIAVATFSRASEEPLSSLARRTSRRTGWLRRRRSCASGSTTTSPNRKPGRS